MGLGSGKPSEGKAPGTHSPVFCCSARTRGSRLARVFILATVVGRDVHWWLADAVSNGLRRLGYA